MSILRLKTGRRIGKSHTQIGNLTLSSDTITVLIHSMLMDTLRRLRLRASS